MSLLNRPSHGFPSSLVVIYHLLLSKGKLASEQIIALCDPPTLNEEGKDLLRKTLNTWCDLGLFQKTENEVTIAPDVPESERSLENLPAAARRVIFAEDNNPTSHFFDIEGAKSSGFIRLLAWSLMQDIWAVNQAGFDGVKGILSQQAPDLQPTLCQNGVRWSGFKSWANFLGFAWSPTYPTGRIEPDPTVAIRETLPCILKPKETLEAKTVVDRIAEALPVLDRGEYRQRVEEKLGKNSAEHAWQELRESQISTSLSRALLRLKEEGQFIFESRDDSTGQQLSLTGPENSEIEKVSHVTYVPNSSIK